MKKLFPIVAALVILVQVISAQTVPDWAKKVVWYQIFPERFRNGDFKNDPEASDLEESYSGWKVSPWTSDWYKLQKWEEEHSRNFYDDVFDRRYGGDFEGIIEELPYLHKLGINAIYLNPIFDSPSLHKYNTSTYIHVDHNFGPDPEGDLKIMAEEDPANPSTWKWTSADRLFLKFIKEAHRLGMKVIIDGVFNHVGTNFWAFKDVLRNQQKSKYKNWFVIKSWNNPATGEKFDYEGWWGLKSLPIFRKDSVTGLVHGPREYIFAITKRWMEPFGNVKDGVDGWRLDVPNEIPHPFWKDYRKLVKGINPSAYIVGEIWGNASSWLKGDEFDAVMNYSLAKAVVHFFIDRKLGISSTEFDNDLKMLRKSYPEDINYVLQNLIDSHDTDRLASMIVNPDRPYNSDNSPRNNPNYSVRKPDSAEIKRQKLIVLFQMTYIGAPMIYYGDEAGMWGATDPDDRKPMLWPDLSYEDEKSCPISNCKRPDDRNVFNWDLFHYYSMLIHERLSNNALMLGTYRTLVADSSNQIFVFERRYKGSVAIVGFNIGANKETISVKLDVSVKSLRDVLSDKTFNVKNSFVKFDIEPGWGILLVNR